MPSTPISPNASTAATRTSTCLSFERRDQRRHRLLGIGTSLPQRLSAARVRTPLSRSFSALTSSATGGVPICPSALPALLRTSGEVVVQQLAQRRHGIACGQAEIAQLLGGTLADVEIVAGKLPDEIGNGRGFLLVGGRKAQARRT